MEIACLDLEGVLVPEIWIAFAEKTGIEALKATTRDIPDYDVLMKLESVRVQLTENTEKPSGKLRITTTVGLGQGWLTDKVQEFLALYPDMQVQLILDNEELDVNMRHADCAIRLRERDAHQGESKSRAEPPPRLSKSGASHS